MTTHRNRRGLLILIGGGTTLAALLALAILLRPEPREEKIGEIQEILPPAPTATAAAVEAPLPVHPEERFEKIHAGGAPSPAPKPADLDSNAAHELAAKIAARHADFRSALRPKSPHFLSTGTSLEPAETDSEIRLLFPETYDRGLALTSRGVTIHQKLSGAATSPPETALGAVVYQHILPGADSAVTWTREQAEEWLHLTKPVPNLAFEIEIVGGTFRLADDTLEALGIDDTPVMRMPRPWYLASGSNEKVPCGEITIAGDTRAILTISLPKDPAAYPILLDPLWISAGSMSLARFSHTTTLLGDGKVLVAGGNSPSVAACELYNPATGTWSSTGSLTTARRLHSALLLQNGRVLALGGLSSSGSTLATCELYDPATGTWTSTGNLLTSRYNTTATLLNDGKVLVVAGQSGATKLTSCELYNPATGTWSTTGAITTARIRHTSTLLANGKVLMAGGIATFSPLTTCQLYDPATGLWTTTGSLTSGRQLHTATLLANGKVLAAGGFAGLNTCELYDPTPGTWSATGNLVVGRQMHAVALLPDGKVLATGGTNGEPDPMTSTETYNPTSGTWTAAPAMASARSSHDAVLLPDARVLLVGTVAATELFEFATPTWTTGPPMAVARTEFTATHLHGTAGPFEGWILIAGGYGSGGLGLASCEIYQWPFDSWFTTNPMITGRSNHTATLLPSGDVLATGGITSALEYTETCEKFSRTTRTWSATGSMTAPRIEHTTTLLGNGKVIAVGGSNLTGILSSCELYDPTAGTWTATGSMSLPRRNAATILLPNGKLLVSGGYGGSANGWLFSCEIYNPASGTWSATGSMIGKREEHTLTLLPNGLVLAAGGWNGTNYLSTCELFNPATGTWTSTGALATTRMVHTATLLHTGRVLVAAGYNGNPVATCEIYDPIPGTWSATASLATARRHAPACLLLDQRVMVVGGRAASTYLSSTEFFNVGLGEVFEPSIGTWPTTMQSGGAYTITGSGFRGLSEGSAGNNDSNSSSGIPVVYLRAQNASSSYHGEYGRLTAVRPTSWSSTSATFTVPSFLKQGQYQIWVTANGSPSLGHTTLVTPGPNTAPNAPTALAQFKLDGTTSIPVGGTTQETGAVLKATVSDPDLEDVKLQVEVEAVGTAFDNVPTAESAFTVSGNTASATASGLAVANYHWQARTVDGNGATSAWVSFGGNPETSADFTVTPPAPANFTGTAASTTSINWSWNDVPNETAYELHDDAHVLKGSTPQNVVTITESSLSENTSYSRHVHATANSIQSPASNTVAKYTKVHDPLAADFSLTVVSDTRIDVSIVAPPNGTAASTGAEISRSTDDLNYAVVRAFSNVYTYSDTGLAPSTTYFYKIRFRNGDALATALSPSKNATTQVGNQPPPAPVITTPSKKTNDTTPTIQGTSVANVTIKVFFNGVQDGTTTSTMMGTWTYTPVTARLDGAYTVQAKASNVNGDSPFSNAITITIDTVANPPTNLCATPLDNQVHLTWSPSPDLDVIGYEVFRKPQGSPDSSLLKIHTGVVVGTFFCDSGAANGSGYCYKVRAVDNTLQEGP